LTEEAEAALNALPVWLQRDAESYISDILAKDPVRAASKPERGVLGREVGARSNLQIGPIDGAIHHLTFLFRFSQDETKIEITAIGYMPVRLSDEL
jgi:hypothetical protein